MNALTARHLTVVRGGRKLLDRVSLNLARGSLHALLGGNGAGKSTLIRILSREWHPDTGELLLAGQSIESFSPAALARMRAVLPQQDGLDFPLTAREVVELGRYEANPGLNNAVVDEVMVGTDVLSLADRRYPELSGGERRRVQMARVMAQLWDSRSTRILLLDEPVAGLDLSHQHELMRLLQQLAATRGFSILVSLHDLNLAAHYADQISLLNQGQLVAQGPTAEMLQPVNLTATFGNGLRFVPARHENRVHWLIVPA